MSIDGVGTRLPLGGAVAVTDADLDRLFGPTASLAEQLVERRPTLGSRGPLEESFVRYCAVQDLRSGRGLEGVAVAAGGPLVSVEVAQPAAPGEAVVIRPSIMAGPLETYSATHAEVWAGYAGDNLRAIAVETGSGFRQSLETENPVDDAFKRAVGDPVERSDADLSHLPPNFRYEKQFVRGATGPDEESFYPVYVGDIRFPSGRACVIDPNTRTAGVTVDLKIARDREFPCFVSKTSEGNMTLLVRLGDGVPDHWALAPLDEGSMDPSGHGCAIDTGTISVIDAAALEALRRQSKESGRGNTAREIVAQPCLVTAVAEEDPDLFSVFGFGGDLPNDVIVGLHPEGGINALVVDMGGYWYEDQDIGDEQP